MRTVYTLTALAAALLPGVAKAGVTITWTEVGNNFQAVVSGSFSSQELAAASFNSDATFNAGASFDTSPSFSVIATGGQFNRRFISSSLITKTPNFTRLNSYSGNVATGSQFSYFDSGSFFIISIPTSYVAGDSISSTLQSARYGNTLQSAFTFGEVVKLNGNALITFVDGSSPVPEPSTYGLILGGLALAGAALRRRRAKRG
jgi:hypothetical protein